MTHPEKIGKYVVERELGHGGMAVVYLARDPHLGRLVAIKMILPDKGTDAREFLNRFQNEAKVVATLNHPAIVPIYEYDIQDGQPYLVMQYMPGGSLADHLQQGPLSITAAAHILERIAPALDKVHQKNYIHRDLKPSNILFDDEGRPYLADFGLVKSVSDGSTAMTKDGLAMGTQAYMSPEQAMGQELDGRSDIYTLGVILFEMLTGQRPYQASPSAGVALAVKHVVDPVPNILEFKGDLPSSSQKIIDQAMAKKKDERFSSGRALAQKVSLLAREGENQAERGIGVPQKPTNPNIPITHSRWRPLVWLALAGVGLFVPLTVFLLWSPFGRNVQATPTVRMTIPSSAILESPTSTPTSLPTSTRTPTPSKTPIPTFTARATFTPLPTVATPTIAPMLTVSSTPTTTATRRPTTPTPTGSIPTIPPIPPTSSASSAPTSPPPPPEPTSTSAPPPPNTLPPPTNTLAPENTPTNTLAPG